MRVLISDKLPQEGIDILRSANALEVDCIYDLTPDTLKARVKDYHALIIRSTTTVTKEIIDAAKNLRVIGRAGVGLDNIDLVAAKEKQIEVCNVPSGNTVSTAEHTIGMILSLARHIPQANASMKEGKWERALFKGVELKGKSLGIIGFGRIGSTLAGYARALGMTVNAYDPFLGFANDRPEGIGIVKLNELLKCSDFITVHVPLNAVTQSLISHREFSLMKDGARIINCARGGIVDEQALIDALRSEKIAGCALDVFEREPLEVNSPLLAFDNCIVTPHIGAATGEAQVNVAIEIARRVRAVLLDKKDVKAKSFA